MGLWWFIIGLCSTMSFIVSAEILQGTLGSVPAHGLSGLIGSSATLTFVWLLNKNAARVPDQLRPTDVVGTRDCPIVPRATAETPIQAASSDLPLNSELPLNNTVPLIPAPHLTDGVTTDCVARPEPPRPEPEASTAAQSLVSLGFHGAVEEFKKQLLAEAIASCGGNRAEAARRLGLQRTYLYRLVKQLKLKAEGAEME